MPTNHIPHPHSSWAPGGMVTLLPSWAACFNASLLFLRTNVCCYPTRTSPGTTEGHYIFMVPGWLICIETLVFRWQMASPRLISFTWTLYQLLPGAGLLEVHLAGQLMEHPEAAGGCSAVLDVPGPSAGFPIGITRVWEGGFFRFCSLKTSFFEVCLFSVV